MALKPQIIYDDGVPAFVVLPWAEWQALRGEDGLGDEEIAALISAEHDVTDRGLPLAVVERMLAGGNPVAAIRKHCGLKQKDLAERAGIGVAYLSQIETGRRRGSLDTLKALARALEVELEDLV